MARLDTYGILSVLRENSPHSVLLSSLLPGGKLPPDTGAGTFGASLASLLEAGFVKAYNHVQAEISSELISIGVRGDWSLRRGYELANKLLQGHEHEIALVLTDRLADVQTLLGVSLTDLRRQVFSNGMWIEPAFGLPPRVRRSDLVVLMPFHDEINPVYHDHIMRVAADLGLTCARADSLFGSKRIIVDIWDLICNARFVLADCTGRNPNVFYELGIAHTLGKKVIITTQSSDDIPFNIRHIRYILYHYTPRGMQDFERQLKEYIRTEAATLDERAAANPVGGAA